MHISSLVHTGISLLPFLEASGGGYLITEEVSKSLRFGNFLKPIIGASRNICPSSSQLEIMFQFDLINFLISGLVGVNCVTITGVSTTGFSCVESKSSCEKTLALL